MRESGIKILLGIIICIAAGLFCASPQFVVYAAGTDSQEFYRTGSGKDITAPSDPNVDPDAEDAFGGVESASMSLMSAGAMTTSQDGISILTYFEGCRLTAYKAVSTETYWTIGYGHYGPDVTEGMTITQQQAEELLKSDLQAFEGYVNNFLNTNGLTVTQKQFDALVSFSYNVGTKWMTSSTIRTYLINGIANYTNEEITTAFAMWNTSGGQVLTGLTRRRNAEAALFLGGPLGVYITNATSLNVRSGPGTSYSKVGALINGTKISICEIKGYWGRYSEGWVSLDYCIFYEARAMISSFSNTTNGVSLVWTPDPDAASYNIMRKTAAGDAELIASVTGTSYVDQKVVSGTAYTYYINSVSPEGVVSAGSAALTGISITYYAVPTLSSITNTAEGVTLKWKKVAGAQKYRILRKTDTGAYKTLADTTGVSWVDQTAVSGKKYTYTVVCLNSAGTGIVSAYDTTGLSIVYIARPASVTTKNTSTGIKISWTASAGAVKYRIFRKKGTGSWKELYTTKKTSYTDKTVTSGSKYYYRIRCVDSKGVSYTSTYSKKSSVLLYLKQTTVKVSKIKWGVKIKWSKVKGASGYYIYRRTTGGSWKKIAKVTGYKTVTYKDMNVQTGKTYRYRVRAYSGKKTSVYSKSVKIKR